MRYSFDNTVVKIGRANDVEQRRQQLQRSQDFTIDVVGIFEGAGHLEKLVHDALSTFRSSRGLGKEWFVVDAAVATAASVGIMSAAGLSTNN